MSSERHHRRRRPAQLSGPDRGGVSGISDRSPLATPAKPDPGQRVATSTSLDIRDGDEEDESRPALTTTTRFATARPHDSSGRSHGYDADRPAQFRLRRLCESPQPCNSSASTSSDESMKPHVGGGNLTPPPPPPPAAAPLPPPDSQANARRWGERERERERTAKGMGQLSLQSESRSPRPVSELTKATATTTSLGTKRTASGDWQPQGSSGSEVTRPFSQQASRARTTTTTTKRHVGKADDRVDALAASRKRSDYAKKIQPPLPRDPAFCSMNSPDDISFHQLPTPTPKRQKSASDGAIHHPSLKTTTTTPATSTTLPPDPRLKQRPDSRLFHRADPRWPDLIPQPKSCAMSNEDLRNEINAIHHGLIVVEAKCIDIDAAQAADQSSPLGPEQYQALIALHRTYFFEIHDFLLATQHPTASAELRALPAQLSIPARMWKHGIHSFLEILRHRRPESQDYMLSFICLAYQMIALLLETVQVFTDTWVECLGDLARYRMAVEELKEEHLIWGGVAARWYTIANDKHPGIGRLNHHLGILERPGLRKFCLYAKALTSIIPFTNARESLKMLCGPLVNATDSTRRTLPPVDAHVVRFYAAAILGSNVARLQLEASTASAQLRDLTAEKIRDCAVPLFLSNVAMLMELGAPSNALWQLFAGDSPQSAPSSDNSDQFRLSTSAYREVTKFVCTSTNLLLRAATSDPANLLEALPLMHVLLAWLHTRSTQSPTPTSSSSGRIDTLLLPDRASWTYIATYLNALTKLNPHLASPALATFPQPRKPHRPLREDFALRGLIWTQSYFPTNWFTSAAPDTEGRDLESADTHRDRVVRVLGLARGLSKRTERLKFHEGERRFWAVAVKKEEASEEEEEEDENEEEEGEEEEGEEEEEDRKMVTEVKVKDEEEEGMKYEVVARRTRR